MDINSSYAAAMRAAIPGTFVPDVGAATKTQPLDDTGAAGAGGVSFKDTVKSLLSDVNSQLQQSDQMTRDLATGKTNDISKVVTSVEEANLSMEYTLAIRNKLLQAYTEISQMQF